MNTAYGSEFIALLQVNMEPQHVPHKEYGSLKTTGLHLSSMQICRGMILQSLQNNGRPQTLKFSLNPKPYLVPTFGVPRSVREGYAGGSTQYFPRAAEAFENHPHNLQPKPPGHSHKTRRHTDPCRKLVYPREIVRQLLM